ncbi:MAG: hypothetical protein M1814_001072 [Vezdaea aestivalis]|nr:MAG: hypothetical protein M1814_001072 [Vezdaea aestivalis]
MATDAGPVQQPPPAALAPPQPTFRHQPQPVDPPVSPTASPAAAAATAATAATTAATRLPAKPQYTAAASAAAAAAAAAATTTTASTSNLSSIANAGLRASPVPISPSSPRLLAPKSPLFSSRPVFTGEAALSAAQHHRSGLPRSSPNRSLATLNELRSPAPTAAMSRPHDAPLPSPSRIADAANPATDLPGASADPMQIDASSRTSPALNTILAPLSNMAIPVGSGVLDPALVGKGPPEPATPSTPHLMPPANESEHAHRSHTYPGPLPQPQSPAHTLTNGPTPDRDSLARGMSLPTAGFGDASSPRSPSGTKKHKCHHCNTEFTRHHNLKSHLLTHSHEKPYLCKQCHSRFRRLHDLKRHSKLHTGERPHRCGRCGRQFARGDALARHNKGHGGCAGRRTSMGSFADDDEGFDPQDHPEDQMDGLQYADKSSVNGADDSFGEDERRRRSLPGIQTPQPPQHPNGTNGPPHVETAPMYQSQYPRSYPPALPRQQNSLQPPAPPHPNPSSPTSTSHQTLSPKPPSVSTTTHGPNGAAVFAHGSMTESPKPLSPGALAAHQLGGVGPGERHRSPNSYSSSLQHMSRLPPPNTSGPVLAPLAPPSAQNSGPTGLSSYHHQQLHPAPSLPTPNPSFPPPTSTAASASSGSAGGSEAAAAVVNNVDRMWAVIQNLESKVARLTEEVEFLRKGGAGPAPTTA